MIARALAAAAFLALGLGPAVAQKGPAAPLDTVVEVSIAQLPPEARETITRVRKGGPFPYAKDGAVFGNREGHLPAQKRGYYKEYTVKTPGERTRGARRIIAGAGGELYYSDDHYNHFRRVRE
jgi:ribonuclease T1